MAFNVFRLDSSPGSVDEGVQIGGNAGEGLLGGGPPWNQREP